MPQSTFTVSFLPCRCRRDHVPHNDNYNNEMYAWQYAERPPRLPRKRFCDVNIYRFYDVY